MNEFNITNNTMADKEIMSDVLESQKQITGYYNAAANEAAAETIRREFLNILNEEHQIQAEVFYEMQKRGWYPTQPAEQQQVQQTKQKFQSMG